MTLTGILATTAALAFVGQAALAADIFAIGGKPDDPFWGIVKRGAEDAGIVVRAQGGSVTRLGPQNHDNLGVDAAELIRHIGAIGYPAGVAGGEYVGGKGAKNGLCINSLPGAASIEDCCNGFVEGITKAGGQGSVLPLPATAEGNVTAVSQAPRAHLPQNRDIDAVFTTANLDAVGAVQGIAQAGKSGQIQVCGVNVDEAILAQIAAGTQACAIDQQGYQQGFCAVSILNGHINYGPDIPTREILTGPGVVDAANIAATLTGARDGTR